MVQIKMSQYSPQLLGNFVFLIIQKPDRIKFKTETGKCSKHIRKGKGWERRHKSFILSVPKPKTYFSSTSSPFQKIFLNKKTLIFHPINCWKTAFQYYLQASRSFKFNQLSHIFRFARTHILYTVRCRGCLLSATITMGSIILLI